MATKQAPLPRSLKLRSMAKAAGRGATTCGNPLRFTTQPQQQTEWCWAAVGVSINLYYHPTSGQTQCAVVNSALGQTTCCIDGSTPACNQPWYVDVALQIFGNFGSWIAGKVPLAKVKNEVSNCRPVCLRIAWNGGGAHFVTLYGFSTGYLNVGDPFYGNSVVTYSAFPGTYQVGGTWTDTYTTKS